MEKNPARIVLNKTKAQGMIISRFPEPTRSKFIEFSNEEFAGDYGMCLQYLWNTFELWNTFMSNWDIKLNYIIELLDEKKREEISPEGIRLLSGRRIDLKGGEKKDGKV